MTEEPYRLFDYYRYEDRDLFFGREEEVARMVGDILSSRLLALFAPSGSGKSSLLRAGVQPALEKRNFEAVFTRVGEDPIASIVTAIETLDSTPSRGATDLVTALTGRTKPVVVVIDQFEELFIQFGEESGKRKDFPVKLAEALFDPSLRVYFVLSLRSDYFVCLNEFRDAIPTIFHNNANLELRPFDDPSARDAIAGPSERPGSGFTWEKDLPERIVRDLKAHEINPRANGVLPITLQVVCHTLWSRLPVGRGEITAKSYDAEGGAAAIIERRIFQALEATPARDRRLLCRLLRELITKDGTKRIQSVKRLHDALGSRQQKRTDALLARFNQALLLREETSRGETWVELRHDYLAARMKPWLDEEEHRLDARRRRNNALAAIACAIVAGLGVWLWNDFHTYTAEIGTEASESDPEDELVVTRRRPLGLLGTKTDFSLWKFSVGTGFSRPLLQDGKIPHNTFNVPNAPSDWTAIGEHLAKPARDRFILATRLDSLSPASSNNRENSGALPDFDALKCADIGYYGAADNKILCFALRAMTISNPKVMSSAADALGRLGANLPDDRVEPVAAALLVALKNTDSDVKSSAAAALGTIGANLSAPRADAVATALLAALQDNRSDVKRSTIAALGNLGAGLTDHHAEAVVAALLAALKDHDPYVKHFAADVLARLGVHLPAARTEAVVADLKAALERGDSFGINGITAADALSRIGATLPTARADPIAQALMDTLKEKDSFAKSSIADALGRIGANLSPACTDAVIQVLLASLGEADSNLERSAAETLVRLRPKINAARAETIVETLLHTLKDSTLVSSPKARALGRISANLTAPRIDAVVETLLAALKGNGTFLKIAAADALGGLGASLPALRADEIGVELLAALKNKDSVIKSSAAEALGSLGAILPASRADAVLVELLTALKNDESSVKRSAAIALGDLAAIIPASRADAVVSELLAALKDNDPSVKSSAAAALGQLKAVASRTQAETAIIRLSSLLATRGGDDIDSRDQYGSAQRCIRQLTAYDSARPSELLLQDLESAASRKRIVAIHMLARRSHATAATALSPEQLQKIRQLRDDPKHRPWVRMAALDTLMEIEREKDALARDKEEAEEKAKKEKAAPKQEE